MYLDKILKKCLTMFLALDVAKSAHVYWGYRAMQKATVPVPSPDHALLLFVAKVTARAPAAGGHFANDVLPIVPTFKLEGARDNT